MFFITCRYYYSSYYYYRFIFYLVHLTLLMSKVAKVNVQQNFQMLFCNVVERYRLRVLPAEEIHKSILSVICIVFLNFAMIDMIVHTTCQKLLLDHERTVKKWRKKGLKLKNVQIFCNFVEWNDCFLLMFSGYFVLRRKCSLHDSIVRVSTLKLKKIILTFPLYFLFSCLQNYGTFSHRMDTITWRICLLYL